MKNIKTNIVMLGALTLLLTSSVFAQMPCEGHGKMGMGRKHMPILSHAEELGLSERQVEELKNIYHEFQKNP